MNGASPCLFPMPTRSLGLGFGGDRGGKERERMNGASPCLFPMPPEALGSGLAETVTEPNPRKERSDFSILSRGSRSGVCLVTFGLFVGLFHTIVRLCRSGLKMTIIPSTRVPPRHGQLGISLAFPPFDVGVGILLRYWRSRMCALLIGIV